MRILAINPWFPVPDAVHDEVEVPLGLLQILTCLARQHVTEFVELSRPASPAGLERELHAVLETVRPDFILVAANYSIKYPASVAILNALGRVAPGIPRVTGGLHASALRERVFADCPGLEVLVIGEAEWTVAEVLARWDGSTTSVAGIAGTLVSADGRIVDGGPRQPGNLAELPVIDYGYMKGRIGQAWAVPVIGQRGCPFSCRFCVESSALGRRIRRQPLGKTLAEIRSLVREHGVRLIGIEDSILDMGGRHFRELFEALCREDLPCRYYFLTRAAAVQSDGCRLLERLGRIKFVAIGAESADPDLLAIADKRQTITEVFDAARTIGKHRLPLLTFWLNGLPGSSPAAEERTREAIRELKRMDLRQGFEVSQFVPYPGTLFFEQRDRFGLRVVDWDFGNWGRFSCLPVYELDGFSREAIHAEYLATAALAEAW